MKQCLLASLFAVALLFVSNGHAQELRPTLDNGRPALRFGNTQQCSSLITYAPLDGEAEAIGVPVVRDEGKTREVGMLFFNETSIIYRVLPIEHAFVIPRVNFKGASVSIRHDVYYLVIKSMLRKDQEFQLSCTLRPDVFSYVAMIANDFAAGTAEFKRLTSNVATKTGSESQATVAMTEKVKDAPSPLPAATPITSPAIPKVDPNVSSAREGLVVGVQKRDDEIDQILAQANDHFRNGKQNLEENRPAEARAEFDKAVGAILSSGVDVRNNQRLQTFYVDLVEKIHRQELLIQTTPNGRAAIEAKGGTKQAPGGFVQLSMLNLTKEEQKVSATQLDELEQAKKSLDFNFGVSPLIQAYINYYQGRGHRTMEAGLRRSGRFMKLARETFRHEGVPEDIIWLAQVESGWNPQARSWAAASGLWQFLPGTGAQYGLQQTAWVDERNGIEKSTQASARCLKDLARHYNGDWLLAMAAYNTGALNVDRAIARVGAPNYWQIFPYIAQETRNYVPNILAVALIANNPDKYGFSGIRREAPIGFDPIVVPSTTSLRLIADATDTGIESIEALNPELKRDTTPPGDIYTLRIPVGKWKQLASVLKRIPIDRRNSARVITVIAGEELQSVANRTGVSVASLQAMNAGVDLKTTNKLVVSNDSARLTNWRRASSTAGTSSASNLTKVRAHRGDTIAKIAAARQLSADELARLNGILPNTELQEGQEIKLPGNLNRASARQR